MLTRILKKESSLKALPLVMMLVGLLSMAQNCGAMEKEKVESVSLDTEERKNNTLSALVSDGIQWPEVSSDLLQLIPLKEPQENWNKVRKVLRFFNDPGFYKQIEKREAEKPGGINAYQAALVKEGWEAKEFVLKYLVSLYRQTEKLISKLEEYQQVVSNLERIIIELRSKNQKLMEQETALSREKEKVVEQNEMLTQDINGSIKGGGLGVCDLEEMPVVVLGSQNQNLLGDKVTLSGDNEEFIEKNKTLIKDLKEIEEINKFIEDYKLRKLELKETLAGLENEIKELLMQKEELSREKEELARGNNMLDLNVEEGVAITQAQYLLTQIEEIHAKKERLALDPQILEQIDGLKLVNQTILEEKESLSKQNESLSKQTEAILRREREVLTKNKELIEANQYLSNKVSFLLWGGASCAAIAVFYIILQRDK